MKYSLVFILTIFISLVYAADKNSFNTQWIPSKPEMLTYSSTSTQGNGLYQVSIEKMGNEIEVYMNIITNGFTKTVSGVLDSNALPIRSTGKIIVNGQITMDTKCSYGKDKLHISTFMKPYNQTMKNDLEFKGIVIDFSSVPLIPRLLELHLGAEYSFQSLNPQKNIIIPFTLKVIGEEKLKGIDCFKVESHDFEGESFLWIEKEGTRRILKIEQTGTKRITELIF